MASKTQDRAELERRMWREIGHVRVGMLGLTGGPPRHMQPMSAFCEPGEPAIWFFARRGNSLLRDAAGGHPAMFTLMTGDHEFIACIGGELSEDTDRSRIDSFWNAVAGAWFPKGKDDPDLTLLRLDVADAEVWVSRTNPVRFGWEIAKANLTHTTPDVGEQRHLNLG